MRNLLLVITFALTAQSAFSQNKVDSYVGTWDGFGYLELPDADIREGCMARLIIEKIPSRTDSLKCTLINIPTNGREYIFPDVRSNSFNVAVKSSSLIKTLPISSGVTTVTTVTQILNKNKMMIRVKQHYGGEKSGYLDYEYLFAKSLYPHVQNTFFSKIKNCVENQADIRRNAVYNDKSKNMLGLSSTERSKAADEEIEKLKIECLLKNTDLSNMSFSYMIEFNILTIEIAGFTPIWLIINLDLATSIMKNKDVKFRFKEVSIEQKDAYNAIGYIVPLKVDVIFPKDDEVFEYPQRDFLYLSTKVKYPAYIRMSSK